jgi:ribonuclease BN (tRNA processing enzyme)
MRLTVIGCWAAYPRVNEACSGYLLEEGATRVLLDCGHSVYAKLGQYTGVDKLDAVVITHYHPDHYVDLYALAHAARNALYCGRRQARLNVFLPGGNAIFDYFASKEELRVYEIKAMDDGQVGDISLEFFAADHLMPGFAVKVSSARFQVFYSGDTMYNEGLVQASAGSDILLLETTMVEAEQQHAAKRGHMSTRDVAMWAHICQPGLLLATHFWEGYEPNQVEAELAQFYRGEFVMAREGLKIEI